MDEKTLKLFQEEVTKSVEDLLEKKLGEVVSPMVAAQTRSIVEKMRVDRILYGNDITGLTDEQKKEFVKTAKQVAFGGMRAKAGELLEEVDVQGGFLVAPEVADAILRIAASVGLVL